MNRIILILITVLIGTQYLYSQSEISALSKKKNVRSGTIYFINGETKDFRKLNFLSDNVIITDRNNMVVTESLNGIDHIDGRLHRPGMTALIGGVSGITIGLIAGSIAYPERSFGDWLIDQINGEDDGTTIKKEEVPIILGCAAAGAGIGALIGLGGKKKTIYKRGVDFDVFPGMALLPGEKDVFSVNLVFRIH